MFTKNTNYCIVNSRMLKKRQDFHSDIEVLINETIGFIAEGQLHPAFDCLDKALTMDCNHPRVIIGLKYIRFWQERIHSLSQQQKDIEQAATTVTHHLDFSQYQKIIEQVRMLLQYWTEFKEFIATFESDTQLIQSFRYYIFSRILHISSNLDGIGDNWEILLWQGIAHKGMGNYDKAQKLFSQAVRANAPSARLHSELADTYALVGEDQKARVMFREAFYLDPQDIDIDSFESELFVRLVRQVRGETGLKAYELREWIPIYGTLWGILNVKRELRTLEYGKLRQHIFNYEQEFKENARIVQPRLLNHYFWLIDYLVMNHEEQYKIDDILLKIRSISPEIHKLYTT